jgi:hypothetical protein
MTPIKNFIFKTDKPSTGTSVKLIDFGDIRRNVYSLNGRFAFWVTYSCERSGSTFYWSKLVDEEGYTFAKFDSCDNIKLIHRGTGYALLSSVYFYSRVTLYSLPGKGEIDTVKVVKIIDTSYVYKHDTVVITKKTTKNVFDSVTVVNKTTKQVNDTVYSSNTTIVKDDNPQTLILKDVSKLLTVFPNPSSSFINVPYSISDNGSVKFYDNSGKLVSDNPLFSTSNSIVINVQTWKAGEYSYIIYSGINKVLTGKFVNK